MYRSRETSGNDYEEEDKTPTTEAFRSLTPTTYLDQDEMMLM